MLMKPLFHSLNDRCGNWISYGIHDDPDDVRPTTGQFLSTEMGCISQSLYRLLHSFPGVLFHFLVAMKDPRHGSSRDASKLGHISHRWDTIGYGPSYLKIFFGPPNIFTCTQ